MSREKKWTQGPWNFHDGFKFYRQNGEYFMFEVGENACSNRCKYDEQWKANAALISAAPELVELLEMATCPVCAGTRKAGQHECKWCKDRDAALAKAYGETA